MSVTIYDIAKIAGVSHTTVSNVINERKANFPVSNKTRERVWQAIRETGYVPSFAARALALRRTNVIACLVNPVVGAFTNDFGGVMDGYSSDVTRTTSSPCCSRSQTIGSAADSRTMMRGCSSWHGAPAIRLSALVSRCRISPITSVAFLSSDCKRGTSALYLP